MPIDLGQVDWLYVAVLAVFAFVANLVANLLSFNRRVFGAVLAAVLFAAIFVFWSYYPHGLPLRRRRCRARSRRSPRPRRLRPPPRQPRNGRAIRSPTSRLRRARRIKLPSDRLAAAPAHSSRRRDLNSSRLPDHGIWTVTQFILTPCMQNWVCPVAWSICQKNPDCASSLLASEVPRA